MGYVIIDDCINMDISLGLNEKDLVEYLLIEKYFNKVSGRLRDRQKELVEKAKEPAKKTLNKLFSKRIEYIPMSLEQSWQPQIVPYRPYDGS